jgi:small GTP-binding protein
MNEMNEFSGATGSNETQANAHLDTLNIVLVGDTGVGKTNLLLSYATDQFNMEHVSTVFDHYSLESEVRGQRIKLEVWDSSGREEHKNLRKFAYSKA